MNVAIRPITLRGVRKWQLDYLKDGKRYRPTFPNKEAAEHERSRLMTGAVTAKGLWASLSSREREEVILAYYRARQDGHSLHELLGRSKELQPHNGPLLGKVMDELAKAKRAAGRSEDYVASLENILKAFARGRESMKVEAVSLANVEAFIGGYDIASRSTIRARLSTLFSFAVRRGYRPDNPCDRLETITRVKPPPQVFTVEQFSSAVEWLKVNPDLLPWFALSTLCGLRPEEAEKTTRKDIHFKEGFVRVEAQTTKVRQRRVVYPLKEAMAFLQWAVNRGKLPIDPQVRKRAISGFRYVTKKGAQRSQGLRHALGFAKWPKDITRHTAASYWLASDVSASTVADMLGNSEKVLKRDYKALVTREEAKRFWKVVATLGK